MKFNKKLSSAIIVSMVVLSAVGCGKLVSPDGTSQKETGNMPKMSEEEYQKGLEDGTMQRDN